MEIQVKNDYGEWIRGSFADAQRQTFIGQLDTLPALIAVHGVVAARDGGDFAILFLFNVR